MWKKDEAPAPHQRAESPPSRTESHRGADGEKAIIGPSITIKGEVSGDEDLLIQGNVEGSVDLELHAVTVGREGRVKADITGRIVTVEGAVDGNLKAQEQIILRSSAKVRGDITAPRVVLEDGASFRGLVDMEDRSQAKAGSGPPARAKTVGGSDSTPERPSEKPVQPAATMEKGKDTPDTASKAVS